MSRHGRGKKGAAIVLPEVQHISSGRTLRNLVRGLHENLPKEKADEAEIELRIAMGDTPARAGGAGGRRLRRRLRRRLTSLDWATALETKNPMNSPNKALRKQIKLKTRMVKMAWMLVANLIRASWRMHGKAPPLELPLAPPNPLDKLDPYKRRIAERGTSIYTKAHPRPAYVTQLSAAELQKVMETIDADKKALQAAMKNNQKHFPTEFTIPTIEELTEASNV